MTNEIENKKAELIAGLRASTPVMVETINDVERELSEAEYEKALDDWAEMRLIQLGLKEAPIQLSREELTKLGKQLNSIRYSREGYRSRRRGSRLR